MKKKTLNILIILSVVFSLLISALLIYFSIIYGGKVIRGTHNMNISIKDGNNALYYYEKSIIAENRFYLVSFIIGTIAAVGITALLIYLLYRINKTELLVAAETTKERVKEYRAERKAAKKEKKKAALQAKLNKLEK